MLFDQKIVAVFKNSVQLKILKFGVGGHPIFTLRNLSFLRYLMTGKRLFRQQKSRIVLNFTPQKKEIFRSAKKQKKVYSMENKIFN